MNLRWAYEFSLVRGTCTAWRHAATAPPAASSVFAQQETAKLLDTGAGDAADPGEGCGWRLRALRETPVVVFPLGAGSESSNAQHLVEAGRAVPQNA